MASFAEFLESLLHNGRVAFRRPPTPADGSEGRAALVVERAFATYRLEVAGPLIDFDRAMALAAGELVRQACWALVSRDDRPEDLRAKLRLPAAPRTASHHLSADLTLRYLPLVHRRARGIVPDDPLVAMLEEVFRHWPLSGVLAEVEEGPETPADFGGHEGLMLLYAERLGGRNRPAWRPSGRAAEYLELVGGTRDAR